MRVDVAYTGFDIGDEFVVGYGLDYAQRYRNLPFIGTLAPAVYGGQLGAARRGTQSAKGSVDFPNVAPRGVPSGFTARSRRGSK
jgi:hypothetical protein